MRDTSKGGSQTENKKLQLTNRPSIKMPGKTSTRLSGGADCFTQSYNVHDSGSTTDIDSEAMKAKIKRRHSSQPPHTSVYMVKDGDTLMSIAATYDTTPSRLRNMNHLSMDYVYPGQLLYVPVILGCSDVTKQDSITDSQSTSQPEDKFSTLSLGSDGLAELMNPQSHSDNVSSSSSSTTGKATPISSQSSVHSNSDLESAQQFLKLHSRYITGSQQAIIDGTLLITPNAVMFDPNVSDPLVVERGIDEYGVIAKMDSIVAAAIYRDIQAIECLQRNGSDENMPMPEIYHAPSCTLVSAAQVLSFTEDLNSLSDSPQADHLATDEDSQTYQADDDTDLTTDAKGSPIYYIPVSANNATSQPPTSASQSRSIKVSSPGLLSSSLGVACSCGAENKYLRKALLKSAKNSDSSGAIFVMDMSQQRLSRETSADSNMNVPIIESNSQVRFHIDTDECSSPSPRKSYSHADNLQYLLEDVSQSGSSVEDVLSTSIKNAIMSSQRPLGKHSRQLSNSSSLYSVPFNENTEVYVDFTCGLFAQGSLPNCNVIAGKRTYSKTNVSTLAEEATAEEQTEHDVLTEASRSNGMREGEPSETNKNYVLLKALDNWVPLSSLRHINSPDEDEPSFYFCLQVAKPKDKMVSEGCPFESYAKQRKKPVYWFSIPASKADSLYNFLLHWHPDRYRENISSEEQLSSNGFIPIKEEDISNRVEELPCSSLSISEGNHKIFKDWEIVSMDEIMRRKTLLDIENYLPLPELSTDSCILTEDHLRQLAGALPARMEGHQWNLVFSHNLNGYSLNAMFRKLWKLDSPVLLVIEDTDNMVFGAFSTNPFHVSEHFLGTGECFLFTFVDGFKVYSWSGKNTFFNRGCQEGLTIGAGRGSCGLWMDENLYRGRTQCCDTFSNDPLTGDKEDFIIKSIEVWSFHELDDFDESVKEKIFLFSSP